MTSLGILFGLLLLPATVARAAVDGPTRDALGRLRVPFVANDGQVGADVAYYARTFAGTLFVTREGQLVYSLRAPATVSAATPKRKIRNKR